MSSRFGLAIILGATALTSIGLAWFVSGQVQERKPDSSRPRDAVQEAQSPREIRADRPELKKSKHDESDVFKATKATPLTAALDDQPKGGDVTGFDFYRDPLNSDKPMTPADEIVKQDI